MEYSWNYHLEMNDGFKETLLDELKLQIERQGLDFEVGTFVQKLSRKDNIIHIETNKNAYMAEKVVLAIGKAGNSSDLPTGSSSGDGRLSSGIWYLSYYLYCKTKTLIYNYYQ